MAMPVHPPLPSPSGEVWNMPMDPGFSFDKCPEDLPQEIKGYLKLVCRVPNINGPFDDVHLSSYQRDKLRGMLRGNHTWELFFGPLLPSRDDENSSENRQRQVLARLPPDLPKDDFQVLFKGLYTFSCLRVLILIIRFSLFFLRHIKI
jgi:hypothetical protein